MEFADNSNQEKQPYKYNGKELDKTSGLNLYDYSARYMELAIGSFRYREVHCKCFVYTEFGASTKLIGLA